MNLFLLHDCPSDLPLYDKTFSIMNENGSIKWRKNGKLHRDDDLPAVIWHNVSMELWKNG